MPARLPVYHAWYEIEEISAQTMAKMQDADILVADLSLERPSCYYELGVAQALGHPIFLVAAAGTPIHQVANRRQIHFYEDIQELSILMNIAIKQ